VAVVVSRKVSKSAVVRNRIRRRVYEIVRRADNVPPSTDLIFTVFGEQVAELEATKLQATVAELLQKAI
jgi:ribonuclease P protein component